MHYGTFCMHSGKHSAFILKHFGTFCINSQTFWNILEHSGTFCMHSVTFCNIQEPSACILEHSLWILEHSACILTNWPQTDRQTDWQRDRQTLGLGLRLHSQNLMDLDLSYTLFLAMKTQLYKSQCLSLCLPCYKNGCLRLYDVPDSYPRLPEGYPKVTRRALHELACS